MNHLKWLHKIRSIVFVFILQISGLAAQVPVHEEPRHHLVFENEEIRILNVLIPPGDTSLYHIHHTPSLFIRLTSSTTGSQLLGEKGISGRSIAGSILFENLAPPNTRIHRVWNTDTDTFKVIDIELLPREAVFSQKPLVKQNLELEIDTNWVRVYRLDGSEGSGFRIKNKKHAMILVSLDTATVQTKQSSKTDHHTLKSGSYLMIKKRQSFTIKNIPGKKTRFVIAELPPVKMKMENL